MKKVTKEDIDKRREERLSSSNKKYQIKRNVWGISKNMKHTGLKSSEGDTSFEISKEDLETQIVKQAVSIVKRVRRDIESLTKILNRVEPSKIPMICKELGVVNEIEDILTNDNISEALKWKLIYNISEIIDEKEN